MLEQITSKERFYSNERILDLLKIYGTKLSQEILTQSLIDYSKTVADNCNIKDVIIEYIKKIAQNNYAVLLDIFIDFFKKVGYTPSSEDIYKENGCCILVTQKSILNLAYRVLVFNTYYNSYLMFKNGNIDTNVLKDNMRMLGYSNKDIYDKKLYIINYISYDLKKYQHKVYLELNVDLEKNHSLNDYNKFNMVSDDLYALSLYVLLNDLLTIQDSNDYTYIICPKCDKIFALHKGSKNKYCSQCAGNSNYSKHTLEAKEQIIKKLNFYKRKIHFEDKNLTNKLEEYCSLNNPGNSRKKTCTSKKDLENFLKVVQEQYKKENNGK